MPWLVVVQAQLPTEDINASIHCLSIYVCKANQLGVAESDWYLSVPLVAAAAPGAQLQKFKANLLVDI